MIDMSNERANIAYVGERPWHSLGNQLEPGTDLSVWCERAGLGHNIIEQPVLFMDATGVLHSVPDKKALVRDDTNAALSIVGVNYNTVQPRALIEFYRSLIAAQGFEMETAGSLMGGKRIWALARTGAEARVKGQDLLRQYVMLATGYDGTMATIATQTSVRVVCWNTFSYAVGENGQRADIRIPHHAIFNPDLVKAEMGLESNAWTQYVEEARVLADRKVSRKDAIAYFLDLFYGDKEEIDENSKPVQKRMAAIIDIFNNGVGQQTAGAHNTAWGLHNAVTRFVDHERVARSVDNRINSAWFGDGQRLKMKSFVNALKLAA